MVWDDEWDDPWDEKLPIAREPRVEELHDEPRFHSHQLLWGDEYDGP